jgi:glycosyltransferase involved in cell wall biosynthesis
VTRVPVVVAARNEEACIGDCLDALLLAVDYAEARLDDVRFDVHVVLDECTDGTGAIARTHARVRTSLSQGGKVEAQRRGVGDGDASDVHVFVDADVLLDEDTLHALVVAMTGDRALRVAFPRKEPLRPVRTTRLARALFVYNRARGFSRARTWFNGKAFAMRGWSIPDAAEVRRRAAKLPRDRFYALDEPLRVDDVYLSRMVVLDSGPASLREVEGGCVRFRAPETLRGMYRYYRRMRRELERTDLLFPETREVHARWGTREATEVRHAPRAERRAYRDFQAALALCRVAYVIERAYARHLAPRARSPRPPRAETKHGLRDGMSTRG